MIRDGWGFELLRVGDLGVFEYVIPIERPPLQRTPISGPGFM